MDLRGKTNILQNQTVNFEVVELMIFFVKLLIKNVSFVIIY